MPYTVKYGDATTYSGDMILNSIGTNGSLYGELCYNILRVADSFDIKKQVDSVTNAETNSYIITDGGCLKCKHIMHIVTPFAHCDEDYALIKQSYSIAIQYAIEQGYTTLGLPFIGTGANGYTEDEVYKVLSDLCSDMVEQEEITHKTILNITILGYLKKRNPYSSKYKIYKEYGFYVDDVSYSREDYIDRDLSKTEIISSAKVKQPKKQLTTVNQEILRYMQNMASFNEDDMFAGTYKDYTYPFDFVDDYMMTNGIKDKVLTNIMSSAQKSYYRSNRKSPSKIMIYRICFVLGFNLTQVMQLMTLYGYSFSPFSKTDTFFMDYLTGVYDKVTTTYALDNLAYGNLDKGDTFTL